MKAGELVLCLCDVLWTRFNSLAGSVALDPGEQINSIRHPGDPYTTLVFRFGDFDGLTPKPAWALNASIGFNGPDRDSPARRWQVGFIQTVESLDYEALYAKGWGRKAMATKSRDSGDPTVDAPWYGPPGTDGEPIILQDAPSNHPTFSDDPTISLLVAHPDAPCRQLESVTMKGKFHLWLIARDPRDPLDKDHLRFLWHVSITAEKSWELPFGKDPFLVPNWNAKGKQTKASEDLGQGTQLPVLDTPVANSVLQFATHKRGTACPPAAAKP